jgi:glutathione S-transferase
MKWVSVDEARTMPGIRLVLQKSSWAAWSECAKNILYYKKLPYAPVPQFSFEQNPEIVAWTGVRNQPQLVYENDPVRTNWLDILNLAERLAPEPALLPQDSAQRAMVVGLSNELCGEWGLGWCKRLQVVKPGFLPGAEDIMKKEYGLVDGDVQNPAERRMAEIVAMLAGRLHEQKKAGSRYFVGDQLTAIDIYWATFSNLLRPLPQEVCALNDNIRVPFSNPGAVIEAAMDPILYEHRDYIYNNFLQLPIDFG